MQMMISKRGAKKLVHEYLVEHQLEYSGVYGETINFTDLARESVYIVTVMGWKPSPEKAMHVENLKLRADLNGFMVDFTEGIR